MFDRFKPSRASFRDNNPEKFRASGYFGEKSTPRLVTYRVRQAGVTIGEPDRLRILANGTTSGGDDYGVQQAKTKAFSERERERRNQNPVSAKEIRKGVIRKKGKKRVTHATHLPLEVDDGEHRSLRIENKKKERKIGQYRRTREKL